MLLRQRTCGHDARRPALVVAALHKAEQRLLHPGLLLPDRGEQHRGHRSHCRCSREHGHYSALHEPRLLCARERAAIAQLIGQGLAGRNAEQCQWHIRLRAQRPQARHSYRGEHVPGGSMHGFDLRARLPARRRQHRHAGLHAVVVQDLCAVVVIHLLQLCLAQHGRHPQEIQRERQT